MGSLQIGNCRLEPSEGTTPRRIASEPNLASIQHQSDLELSSLTRAVAGMYDQRNAAYQTTSFTRSPDAVPWNAPVNAAAATMTYAVGAANVSVNSPYSAHSPSASSQYGTPYGSPYSSGASHGNSTFYSAPSASMNTFHNGSPAHPRNEEAFWAEEYRTHPNRYPQLYPDLNSGYSGKHLFIEFKIYLITLF